MEGKTRQPVTQIQQTVTENQRVQVLRYHAEKTSVKSESRNRGGPYLSYHMLCLHWAHGSSLFLKVKHIFLVPTWGSAPWFACVCAHACVCGWAGGRRFTFFRSVVYQTNLSRASAGWNKGLPYMLPCLLLKSDTVVYPSVCCCCRLLSLVCCCMEACGPLLSSSMPKVPLFCCLSSFFLSFLWGGFVKIWSRVFLSQQCRTRTLVNQCEIIGTQLDQTY